MIPRPKHLRKLTGLLKSYPVVGIIGPRQIGKTTFAGQVAKLAVRGRKRWGFEVKRTSAPTITPSMRTALSDLKLQRLFVVHAGQHSFDMTKKIRAIALPHLLDELKPW